MDQRDRILFEQHQNKTSFEILKMKQINDFLQGSESALEMKKFVLSYIEWSERFFALPFLPSILQCFLVHSISKTIS